MSLIERIKEGCKRVKARVVKTLKTLKDVRGMKARLGKFFKNLKREDKWRIGLFILWLFTTSAFGYKTYLDVENLNKEVPSMMQKLSNVKKTDDIFKSALKDQSSVDLSREIRWLKVQKREIGYADLKNITASQVSKKFGVWLLDTDDRHYSAVVFLESGNEAKYAFVISDLTYAQYASLGEYAKGQSSTDMLMSTLRPPVPNSTVASAPNVEPPLTLLNALKSGEVKTFMVPWKSIYDPVPIIEKEEAELTVIDRVSIAVISVLGWLASNIFQILMIGVLLFMLMPNLFKKKFNIIHPKDNKSDLNNLIGMEDVKEELDIVCNILRDRHQYEEHGIDRPLNIAFSGPPGTGKTKAAAAIAKRLGLPLITMPASNLETGYVAGGANTLKSLHSTAKKMAPCIIFLDEAQTLFKKRGTSRESWADDTANSLLSILDGVPTRGEAPIIWIVASNFDNHNMRQDEAMSRRFPMQVNFRLPNREERFEIIKSYMNRKAVGLWNESDVDFKYLSDVTSNLAPANLENMIENASMTVINNRRKNEGPQMIDTDLLFKSFERLTVGLTDRATTKNKETQRRRIAIHECGHFIQGLEATRYELLREGKPVTWSNLESSTSMLKISTESISKMNALGYVLHRDMDVPLKGRKSMEFDIKGLYGGMAAEEYFYGEDDVSIGAHNDIEKVSVILSKMIAELGLYSKVHINTFKVNNPNGQAEIASQVNAETMLQIQRKAEELYDEALNTTAQYESIIRVFTDRLMSDYVLNINQAFDLLKEHEALVPFEVEKEPESDVAV